jgi:glycine cleavage system H protein
MADVEGYSLPDELHHHKEHMWVRVEGDVVVVGLNDFAQSLAGEVCFVELPEEGDEVSKDEVVGTVETGKWLGKLYAPVSGTIEETNTELEDEASLVNSDPYGSGWMFRIRMQDSSEVEELMQGDAAVAWLKEEIAKHAK